MDVIADVMKFLIFAFKFVLVLLDGNCVLTQDAVCHHLHFLGKFQIGIFVTYFDLWLYR